MRKNGSHGPIFRTDRDRTFFLVKFPVHPKFAETLKKKVATEITTEVTMEVAREVKRPMNVRTGDHSRKELREMLRK